MLQKKFTATTPWLQCWDYRPEARQRLFCFPYAGGGSSLFRAFAHALPPEIEVWGLQLPGREDRFSEAAFTRLDPLITTLTQILPAYLDRPYTFFGHSMGALISFELARALQNSRQLPEMSRLIVSAHRAPHLPDLRPPIHQLPGKDFLDTLQRFNGTPAEILQHHELMLLLLPLLRADFALCETYAYQVGPPLTCPIYALGGLQDHGVSQEAIRAWDVHTNSLFTANFFPGDHFFIQHKQSAVLHYLTQLFLDA